MPWRETVVTQAPDALYVMYPKSDGWGMQAVPQELGTFANRRDLPAAWAGLSRRRAGRGQRRRRRGVLPHGALLRSAGSREGITELARRALETEG